MNCPRCGSTNMKTFEMAYALSPASSIRSWHPVFKFWLFGPLGFLFRRDPNSLTEITAPPSKPFPTWTAIFSVLLMLSILLLVAKASSRGLDYRETQNYMISSTVLLVLTLAALALEVPRYVQAKRRYPHAMEEWKNSLICMQCGNRQVLPDGMRKV